MVNIKWFISLFILLSSLTYGAEKKYTEVDLEKEVNKRVEEKLDKIIKRVKKKSVAELTKEILDREKGIEKRELSVKIKEEKYHNTAKDFERQIAEFENRQTDFIACVDKTNQEQDTRIKKMVEVVANMKPAKAADIISVQDQDIAVRILSKLDTTKASKIFNLLDKEKSAQLQKMYLNMKK